MKKSIVFVGMVVFLASLLTVPVMAQQGQGVQFDFPFPQETYLLPRDNGNFVTDTEDVVAGKLEYNTVGDEFCFDFKAQGLDGGEDGEFALIARTTNNQVVVLGLSKLKTFPANNRVFGDQEFVVIERCCDHETLLTALAAFPPAGQIRLVNTIDILEYAPPVDLDEFECELVETSFDAITAVLYETIRISFQQEING